MLSLREAASLPEDTRHPHQKVFSEIWGTYWIVVECDQWCSKPKWLTCLMPGSGWTSLSLWSTGVGCRHNKTIGYTILEYHQMYTPQPAVWYGHQLLALYCFIARKGKPYKILGESISLSRGARAKRGTGRSGTIAQGEAGWVEHLLQVKPTVWTIFWCCLLVHTLNYMKDKIPLIATVQPISFCDQTLPNKRQKTSRTNQRLYSTIAMVWLGVIEL